MKKESKSTYKPEWTPKNAGEEFAVNVVKAFGSKHKRGENSEIKKKKLFETKELADGVLRGDRTLLAKAITMIESNAPAHRIKAAELLNYLLPKSGNSLRIGISGVPGAGKSSLIETLGLYLIEKGYKPAVLAVDPSSTLTKGSILGDKTRMEKLSRENNCFIRPSPSGGALGGVARKSRETIIACEAAGYDVILIETVGVGQNEIAVRSMVDFFFLVLIPGGGDELQGIKKGVIEISDAIVINKADGDNINKANLSRSEYENALHYLSGNVKDWTPKTLTCSALTGAGVHELWDTVKKYEAIVKKNNFFIERRKAQSLEWMRGLIEEELKERFFRDVSIKTEIFSIEKRIYEGELLPTTAAEILLAKYFNG